MRKASYSFINGNSVEIETLEGFDFVRWQRPPGAIEALGLLVIGEHLYRELMPDDAEGRDQAA